MRSHPSVAACALGREKARTRTSGLWECAGSWRFPRGRRREGNDGREGRRGAVGVMTMVMPGASPCAIFKVFHSYQHLSPKRQLVTFFSTFAGVIGVTAAPLPSLSASGSTRLMETPQGAPGRCHDGTRAVGSEFPSSFLATFAQSLLRYLPGTHRQGSSVTDSS